MADLVGGAVGQPDARRKVCGGGNTAAVVGGGEPRREPGAPVSLAVPAQIKPSQKKSQDHSSEQERRRAKGWRKGRKNNQIGIDREEWLRVEPSQLPDDAEFKGYAETIVQDLRIGTDNVRFIKEKYDSAAERRTITAPQPSGYEGQFGPGLRSLVVTFYYAGGTTEPKIAAFLSQFGISIADGQISNLLIKDQATWQAEKEAVWRVGLESSQWQHMDDTATRVDGENQTATCCVIRSTPPTSRVRARTA